MTDNPFDLMLQYNISLMFIPTKKVVEAWYNDRVFPEHWGDDKEAAVHRAIDRAVAVGVRRGGK